MTTKAHAKHTNHHSTGDNVMSAIQTGGERLNEVVGAVGEKCEELTQSVMERIGEAREKTEQVKKDVERRVRERPIKAVLIATGVGFVLGALWSRRR